ncbi:MAG: transposase [Bacteroidales bacterium]
MIPAHYPNLKLGVYAIMPDHFHGIVTIVDTGRDVGTGRDVETGHAPSLPLGNIIGSFKSAVTREINQTGFRGFGWQERYHDRVIRNEQEFRRIEKYIRDNPKNWK